jgi:hypothetical protein
MSRLRLGPPVVAALFAAGCFFAPQIDRYGYNACESDADCAPERACRSGLCSPPPWNDPAFGTRQLVLVTNESDEEIAAGAAVPVRIGAGQLLETSAIGVDGRFSFYDWEAGAWSDVPAFRDLWPDYLDIWLPLSAALPAGASAPLAWLDATSGSNEPTQLERPADVFALYDEFDLAVLPPERWTTFGTGEVRSADGVVNVPDNAKLVSLIGLSPPISVTFRARVNGANCDQVYLGLLSDDGAGFEPPSLGFFISGSLANTQLEVAPTDASVPSQPSELQPLALDTAEHAFTLDAAEGQVRWSLDGVTLGEPRLSPRFAGETLYAVVDVDGACSVDLERVFATPLPFARPVLTAMEPVEFELLE